MNEINSKLNRIGVFYDGNYFLHVSNYYNYFHPRRSRLSIAGLHEFIEGQVAKEEGTEKRLCQIVDAHYFRGRLNAQEASQRGNQLYNDRVFDDVLMSEGVTTHYLPLKSRSGKKEEKGIDVWLALEAYELAIYKRFNVVVLITSDGDYVPLVRKLNTIGTRVMVLSWDFEYTDDSGQKMVTRTSQDLLDEVTYPVLMHQLIDDRVKRSDMLVNNLFMQTDGYSGSREYRAAESKPQVNRGKILSIKNGYGFIALVPNNLFFHYTDVVEGDFNEMREGDTVEYTIGRNTRGEDVAKNVRFVAEASPAATDTADAAEGQASRPALPMLRANGSQEAGAVPPQDSSVAEGEAPAEESPKE
ncbi:MAG: NYN domain-containing protein [Acidobacteriota bacterium]